MPLTFILSIQSAVGGSCPGSSKLSLAVEWLEVWVGFRLEDEHNTGIE